MRGATSSPQHIVPDAFSNSPQTPFKILAPELKVGAGRFTLKKILGQGGMGMVWLAHDSRLDELVALKFLPPQIRSDAAGLANLRRETLRSRKLSHPNIIRIHDLHEAEGEDAFIAMEFVDGSTLSDLRLQQPGELFHWETLAPLTKQLCDALDYAHGENVVHRDLKPANLMFDSKGRLKLADFGIATVISDSITRVSGGTSGTPVYMSPQQINGKPAQTTDDIYSLGATLYELLTSTPPFYSGQIVHQVLNNPPTPAQERLAELSLENEIPPAVGSMLMACLAKEPGQRPQSARAVADWIGLKPTEHPQSLEATVTPKEEEIFYEANDGRGKGIWVVAAFAILVLLLLGAFGFYWKTKKTSTIDSAPAVSVSPPAVGKSEDAIFSDNFENLDSDGRPVAWMWNPEADGSNKHMRAEGKNHFLEFNSDRDRIRVNISKNIDFHAGAKAIKISARVRVRDLRCKSNADLSGVAITTAWYDNSGNPIASIHPAHIQSDTDWTSFAVVLAIPEGASQRVLINPTLVDAKGVADFDDIQVSEIMGADFSETPIAFMSGPKVGRILFSDGLESVDQHGMPRGWIWVSTEAGEKRSMKVENGNHLFEYQATATTNFMHPIHYNFDLQPTWKKLRISGRIRTRNLHSPGDFSGAMIHFGFYDATWKREIKDENTSGVRTNSDWQRVEKDVLIPTGATHATISPTLSYASGIADFDDIQIELIGESKGLEQKEASTLQKNDSRVIPEHVIFRQTFDGSFETFDAPGKVIPMSDYQARPPGYRSRIKVDGTNHFLELECPAATNWFCFTYGEVNLRPEWKKLKFSMRVRARNLRRNPAFTPSGVTLHVGWWYPEITDGWIKASKASTTLPYLTSDCDWKRVEKTVSIPPRAKHVGFGTLFYGASGIADFDDIQVSVVEENKQ